MSQKESGSKFALLAILIVLISVLATLLNGLLFFLLSRAKRKETFSIKIIKIMSTLDLITGISRCSSFLTRLLLIESNVLESSWYCRIFGFTTFCVPCLSLIFISVLALERYLILCRSTKLTPKHTALVVAIVCIIVLVPNLLVMFNSSYSTDPSRSYCLPHGSYATEISKKLFEFLIIVSYFITAFCYLNIVIYCPRDSSFSSTRRLVWLRAFGLIFTYSVCFVPVIIRIIWNYFVEVDRASVLQIIIPVCVTGITAVDPVLVLALYRPLSKELVSCFTPKGKIDSTIELHLKTDHDEF